MANSLYGSGREGFLRGEISWNNDNIKACILSDTYAGGVTSLNNHTVYSDIASYVLTTDEVGGAGNCITLVSKTTAAYGVKGVAGAGNTTFRKISENQTIGYLALFMDAAATVDGAPATPSTAKLIALLDSGQGIGAGTNGGDILITWDQTKGIFKL